MKKLQRVLSLAIALIMCFMAMSTAFAENVVYGELSPTLPELISEDGIQPYGTSKPSSSSVCDLSTSSYSFNVTKMGNGLYTNKWLTGATKIKVTFTDMSCLQENTVIPSEKYKLKVSIYRSGTTNPIASQTFDWKSGQTTLTFSGLSSSKKYAVYFAVTGAEYIYAFSGTIKKA